MNYADYYMGGHKLPNTEKTTGAFITPLDKTLESKTIDDSNVNLSKVIM